MKFLLDTDTCVFWLRGQTPVRDRLVREGSPTVAISIITLAELRYGAACSARPEANHQAIDAFLSGIALLGIDPATARAFADIKAGLRAEGRLIEDFDLVIAATATVHGLTLVTNNVEHFGRVSNLRLENWT
ncbi:MAG: PIN domain-containing protein [Chloroflexi bacterium]|nr:PIN domain-containing protein [Chloroflexota bacterium]